MYAGLKHTRETVPYGLTIEHFKNVYRLISGPKTKKTLSSGSA